VFSITHGLFIFKYIYMAIIVAHHRVKDYSVWKPFYEEDQPRRVAAGLKDLNVGRKADDPSDVYMIWEAKDPSKFQALANDPGLEAQMKKAGVTSELEVTVIND
jgi:hypothetical protein